METLETICKMYGIVGLVYYEESERFICINGKILYNKETGIITLLSQSIYKLTNLKPKKQTIKLFKKRKVKKI